MCVCVCVCGNLILFTSGMSHLVKEIRTEEEKATGEPGGAAAAVRSPREIQMEAFVGLALKDLNLEQWIGEQGGLVCQGYDP